MSVSQNNRSEIILGINFEKLREYIENQFEPWMSWTNYGSMNGQLPTDFRQCWDFDHIIPLSSAVDEEETLLLNHYLNLRPLCSFENRFYKRDTMPSETEIQEILEKIKTARIR